MANAVRGNTIFVDTTGVVYIGYAKVKEVLLTAAAAAATVVLRDDQTGATAEKVSLAAPINDSRRGGVGARFKTAIHATMSGAGAKAEIILE